MDQDDHEFPAVLAIHWKPSLEDYYDEPSLFKSQRTITIGSYTVSDINYKLKMKTESNSLKRKLSGNSYKEVSVTFYRSSSRSSLKVLNVRGIIFFVHDETHKKLGYKSFRYSFEVDESEFSFEIDVTKAANERECFFYIQGHISIDYPSDTDDSYLANCPAPVVHKLSEDYQCLLSENIFSDITLKCGAVDIPAHRNILAARSPVFRAMLRKTTQESQTGAIEIEDIHPDTVKSMLNFIYCAQMEEPKDLTEASACDLLYAADKYELLDLKEECVSYLKSVISNDNFLRILDAAVAHDDGLKLVVIDHIGTNFTAIEQSSDWSDLKKQNPELVMDILTKIVKFNYK